MSFKYPLLENLYYNGPPLWKTIPKDIWQQLSANTEQLHFKKNTIIIANEDYSRGLYIIKKGIVKIFNSDNTGKEQIIHILGYDSIFGHDTLLTNEPSQLQATAITDCMIELINKETFINILKNSTELNSAFITYLSAVNNILNYKITLFERSPLPQRIALSLLLLNESLGLDGNLDFSREDLGNYIGTVDESLSRKLQILKSHHLLLTNGRRITIINLDGLYQLATNAQITLALN